MGSDGGRTLSSSSEELTALLTSLKVSQFADRTLELPGPLLDLPVEASELLAGAVDVGGQRAQLVAVGDRARAG